jgi:hypothetical protein
MKINFRQSFPLGAICAFGIFWGTAKAEGPYLTLDITNQLTGTSTTGSFFWNDTGRFVVSNQPLASGVPANNSTSLVFDPVNQRFFVGKWNSNTSALGLNSTAFGSGIASGQGSFATGMAIAAGSYSVAFGTSHATEDSTFATGAGEAIGYYSVALGGLAYGDVSFAVGDSMAMGLYSVAAGGISTANGDYSVAFGDFTEANAYGCLVIGRYNKGDSSVGGATTWVATDPIFEIGNGTADNARANALTVYKNGDVVIHKSQGDILMGEFGD